jgi:hypothetical protein
MQSDRTETKRTIDTKRRDGSEKEAALRCRAFWPIRRRIETELTREYNGIITVGYQRSVSEHALIDCDGGTKPFVCGDRDTRSVIEAICAHISVLEEERSRSSVASAPRRSGAAAICSHMNSGAEAFFCGECDKAFGVSSSLRRHERSYSRV